MVLERVYSSLSWPFFGPCIACVAWSSLLGIACFAFGWKLCLIFAVNSTRLHSCCLYNSVYFLFYHRIVCQRDLWHISWTC